MGTMEMKAFETTSAVPANAGGEVYFDLGMMYASGRTVPTDLVLAHKWFNVAVARGYRPAAERRAELAREMSAGEIAAAQREARLFLTQH